MSITSKCNMACSYCHNEGNENNAVLTLKQIEATAKAAHKLGITEFRLTGGEPMIHPNIEQICECLNKNGINISLNTNATQTDKILGLIKRGYIIKATVGMDYFDGKISKDSPVGKSSKEILNNILKIRDAGCPVTIDSVFNGDVENVKNLLEWSLKNGIILKILEINEETPNPHNHKAYIKMRKLITKSFGLKLKKDKTYGDLHGFLKGKKVMMFYRSCCAKRECKTCYRMHFLRLSSDFKFKHCLFANQWDILCDINNMEETIKNAMKRTVSKNIIKAK